MDLIEFTDHYVEIDSLLVRAAVCYPVPHTVPTNDLAPFTACALFIQNQCNTLFKSQARQLPLFGVIQIPTAPFGPIRIIPPLPDRIASGLIQLGFNLPPTENKICLIVDMLPPLDLSLPIWLGLKRGP